MRALLYDTDAHVVPGVEVHLPYQPKVGRDGTYEVDAGKLFGLVTSLLDGLLHEAGPRRRRRLLAVGVSTFWHGLVACSDRGSPLTPLYLWADTRSWRQAERLRLELDAERLHQRTGCLLHPTYWPAKLAWLKDVRPELWSRPVRWLSFWDLVHWRLFGEPRTSVSMASGTGLLKLDDGSWDAALLKHLEVDSRSLAELGVAGDRLGHQWAVRWPDLRGVPILCAFGDGALANLGSGCVDRRQRALTVGTSGALRVLARGLPQRIPDGLWCYRLDAARSVTGGALSNGGNLYAWLAANLNLEIGTLEGRLRRMPPGGHGLTFLPLLAGERSPGFASHATGAIDGLTQATTANDIVRAGLEAVAIEFHRVDQRLDQALPGARRLIANGAGLLASPAWMQIMADAIGKPVAESKAREASSRGAAVMALEHAGVLNGDKLPTEVGRTYRAKAAARPVYELQTRKQEALYDALIRRQVLDGILKPKGPATGGKR